MFEAQSSQTTSIKIIFFLVSVSFYFPFKIISSCASGPQVIKSHQHRLQFHHRFQKPTSHHGAVAANTGDEGGVSAYEPQQSSAQKPAAYMYKGGTAGQRLVKFSTFAGLSAENFSLKVRLLCLNPTLIGVSGTLWVQTAWTERERFKSCAELAEELI